MHDVYYIFCDGGSRGNPGPAAAAYVVNKNGKTIYKQNKYLGIATNNEAEYQAALMAHRWAHKNIVDKGSEVQFIFDSELVTKQLKGIYKIKSKSLARYIIKIKKIVKEMPFSVSYTNVSREKNFEADKLVNQALNLQNLSPEK